MVTVSRVSKLKDANSLKALADVVIDGKVIIKGVRVVEIRGNLCTKLPDKLNKAGEWKSIIEFTDMNIFQEMNTKILEEYNKAS